MLWEFKIPKIILLSDHRRGSEHGSIPSNVLAHPSKLDLLASNRFPTSKANSKEAVPSSNRGHSIQNSKRNCRSF